VYVLHKFETRFFKMISPHRCQKEIAPLLGVLPTAEEEEEEDHDTKPMDEWDGTPSTSKPQDKKKKQMRKQKPRVKVFSAKEGVSISFLL